MPELSFHPGFSGPLLIAGAGVAMVLVALFYARAYSHLKPGQWSQLYSLRMFAVLVVLLLLFRPVLSYQREITERRSIVFLVDSSASMSISDAKEGGTRFETAVDRVQAWWPKLKKEFDLQVLTFADTAQTLGVEPGQGAPSWGGLKADGQATSVSRALAAAAKVGPANRIEAVFLLSDGLHNSAGHPAEAASRLGVPVYAIGVGNSLRDQTTNRDIRLTDVNCPDQMAVENRAQVKAFVEAVGFGGRVVEVELREDERRIATQSLVLDATEGAQEVVFEFTPTVKGIHTYTTRIEPMPDEKIPQNNQRTATALVIDSRMRVLYVEGTLRAEYGALVGRFLTKDPNVEFCALVQTRPNVFMQRSNIEGLDLKNIPEDPEVLKTFKVFLLGDLDASFYQGRRLERIRDRVKEGAGLLMMGGYHSLGPGGFGGTPLEEILPVKVGDREVGQITDPFPPTLTPDGRTHPIFANIRQFFPSLDAEPETPGLPPLEGATRVAALKPGAVVLATHPVEPFERGLMPVLAVQTVGQGRSAVFTGDTTRNWQQALRTLDRDSPFLRFWGQTVRWLAGRSDEFQTQTGIAATADKTYYEPEATVGLSALVRGKEGEAAENAKVIATIRGPDKKPVQLDLAPVAGPAGNYRGQFEPTASGRYEAVVTAEWAGGKLTAEPLAFDVGRPSLEFDRLDLDEKSLQQIAERSRGRYAHITTADRLVEGMERREEKRRVEYEVPLAYGPLWWPLFVAALSFEWLLRKKYQLR